MGSRLLSVLAGFSLLANTALLTVLLLQRSAPPVFGQTADGGGRFVLGTEKGGDQNPICFVLSQLNPDAPHLLVYRVDGAGQLQLTNAREITCDMKLKDNYLPAGNIAKQGKTAPPVSAVCTAVGGAGAGTGGGAGSGGKPAPAGNGKSKDKAEKEAKEKPEGEGDEKK